MCDFKCSVFLIQRFDLFLLHSCLPEILHPFLYCCTNGSIFLMLFSIRNGCFVEQKKEIFSTHVFFILSCNLRCSNIVVTVIILCCPLYSIISWQSVTFLMQSGFLQSVKQVFAPGYKRVFSILPSLVSRVFSVCCFAIRDFSI